MKKILLILVLIAACTSGAYSQNIAVKTNGLGWAAAATMNAGIEVGVAPKWTIGLDGIYNPWTWSNDKKSKAWGLQLEGRYWFCYKYTGHFVGLHTQYTSYDAGMKKYNYDGWLTGAGISYGYALPVAKWCRVEFTLGAGYLHKSYDKTDRIQNRDYDVVYRGHFKKNQFGLTKAGINVVFLLR